MKRYFCKFCAILRSSRGEGAASDTRCLSSPFSFPRFLFSSRSLATPSPFHAVFFSESPFEEVGHANVGGRVSGRPRASATTTSPRYQGQNTGRRMSLLLSANEEVASHSANIMKPLLSLFLSPSVCIAEATLLLASCAPCSSLSISFNSRFFATRSCSPQRGAS